MTMTTLRSRVAAQAAAFVVGGLICGAAYADPPHDKGKGKGKPRADAPYAGDRGSQIAVSVTFAQARQLAIDAGAIRYKPLPPGIRKNLARGKPLPPDIAKQLAPAPMLARLPVYGGHEWRIVGSDLVLIAVATAVVVEVLANVFE